MKQRKANTRRLTQLALLLALVLIMSYTPLGYLPVGPLTLSLLTIPVAIGAMLLGPAAGAVLGGAFGLTSFFNALRGGKDSYTGNVPMWSCTPGDEYNVYVLATSSDEKVADSTSDAVKGTYVAVYDAVEAGVTATISGTKVTVELGNDAISDYYDSGADFEVTLYKDGAKAESKTIKNADIKSEESESGGKSMVMSVVPFGDKGPTTNYSASVTFDVDDAAATYTVTVIVKSTATYYKDSAESAAFSVTKANADQPVGPGM